MSGDKSVKKATPTEMLAAEIAKMRLCPGNEALDYAKRIIELVAKYDTDDIQAQLDQDDVDIDELLKNDRAIMEGVVTMSKMINAMHDELKRIGGEIAKTRGPKGSDTGNTEEAGV